MSKGMKIFTGNSNPELAEKIAKAAGVKLGKVEVKKFVNGETYARFDESVREQDIFLIQSTSDPVNDNLMELLVMIDAAKRSSAKTINAVLPWYGYSLQDRQTQAREPITSKLVADLLDKAGADRVITIDFHAGQIQGFFDIPTDHLTAMHIFAEHIRKKKLTNVIIVSPDAGGVKRARAFAKILNAPLAIVDKRRPKPEEAEITNLIGDVKGKTAIVIDDIVNTGSTMAPVAHALLDKGAKEVYFCATHAILSGPAVERLKATKIKEIIFTDTIHIPVEKRIDKVKILSVSKLLGDAIKRVHEGKSLSELFETPKH